jgi:ATP-binding protein involved in chromosome partitioning
VENMSGMICPHCNEKIEFLSTGGGKSMAEGYRIPFLGQIPFDPQIVQAAEHGRAFIKPYEEMTHEVMKRMEE